MEVLEGEIKFWKPERGWGFIRYPDGELFCHIRDVKGWRGYSTLAVPQRVRFTIGKNPRSDRVCAQNVELIEPIISPRAVAFRDEDDDHVAHVELTQTAFMRRP